MRNIKIVFSYDGGLFYGSQSQKNKKTVQDEIELALYRLTGEKARLAVAGRTDRGVHGIFQVANFLTSSSIPADRFAKAINGRLCQGIEINSAAEVTPEFHSRRNAKKREYLYFIYNGKQLPVIFWGRALHVEKRIDLKKVSRASRYFLGEHDFVNFCAKGSSQKDFTRQIYSLEVGVLGADILKKLKYSGRLVCVSIVADSFLYKMVRFIVGTLIEVGRGRLGMDTVKRLLTGQASNVKFKVSPPCGLYLNEVKY